MEENKVKEPQYRGVNELRRMFLEFFESKGHLAMKSFSLVPHNDNSLLLINSGMAPLKPYFTGPVSYTHLDSTCDRSGQIYTCGIFYYFVPDMDSFEKSVSFYFFSYGSAGDIYKYP